MPHAPLTRAPRSYANARRGARRSWRISGTAPRTASLRGRASGQASQVSGPSVAGSAESFPVGRGHSRCVQHVRARAQMGFCLREREIARARNGTSRERLDGRPAPAVGTSLTRSARRSSLSAHGHGAWHDAAIACFAAVSAVEELNYVPTCMALWRAHPADRKRQRSTNPSGARPGHRRTSRTQGPCRCRLASPTS